MSLAVSSKPGLARRLRPLGLAATLAAGGLLLLVGAATSQPVTSDPVVPQAVDPIQHFIDCAGVLISDPEVHAAYCLPSTVPPDMINTSVTKSGTPCEVYRGDSAQDVDNEFVDDDVVLDGYIDDCGYLPG